MNIFLLTIGILLLAERIGKYLLVKWFFQQSSSNNSDQSELEREEAQVSCKDAIYHVSILQPILSGDPTLWDCLSANLRMKTSYPVEFLWLVDNNDEIGLSGCQDLIAQYPDIDVRLISLPPPLDGISPKTFKLIAGVKEAKGEIIAVLDDDTILPDGGLEECIPFLNKPEIGLAFGLPYYINFSNLWSTLVSCFVNSNSLLTYIPYTYLIKPFTINGMFYVVKREVLDKVNGFEGLEGAICDDYAIAQRFRSHGYQLAQTPVCHGISTQVKDFSHYLSILTRWFVFPQASIMRSATLIELSVFYTLVLLPNLFPLTIITYLLIFPSIKLLIYCLLYLSFNYYMLTDFNNNYLRQATPNKKIIWMLIMQILLPFHMFWSLLSPRKINWRGHIIQITKNGEFNFIQRRITTKPE
jgi:ceramide glucosyltransferase